MCNTCIKKKKDWELASLFIHPENIKNYIDLNGLCNETSLLIKRKTLFFDISINSVTLGVHKMVKHTLKTLQDVARFLMYVCPFYGY